MKRMVFISALCLIFQTAFAQKQDTKLTPFFEMNFQTSLKSSNNDLAFAFKFVKTDCMCLNTNIGKQICKPETVNIARNSSGKHGEGRFPDAYSESLCKPIVIKEFIGSDRNSTGKQGDGIFPGAYSKNLRKSLPNVLIDDVARNSGGRNSN
ncbi:hypothetical protein DWB61_13615 [Ancylomarina euxinus]|uniref:Uncharacterized protein n=1 Tax=Ancylomarina euxinus TaxID=2283627 RepID=A0A425XYM2_9BACT|nr:hypothetical protein [Ancylomarina euxinus]MCZ4695760.1 hypothetical protein [Ancylomarina euxinus]MUP16213.1 hypothetical protein [Ancylomarina euxinus]RRG20072.1 hypothetical protein DWB61_13615 [Ancylomarina euxinus]